jgi:hypothetical protein
MSTVTIVGFEIANPSPALTAAAGTTAGALGAGNYSYKVTYVTAFGETAPSAASTNATTTTGSLNLTAIPMSADGNVTSRNLYRTTSGGGSWAFLHTIADNTTTTYTDLIADGSLGAAAPTFNTAMSREIERGFCARSNPSILSIETGITAGAGGTTTVAYQLSKECSVITTVATLNDSVRLPPLTANLIGMKILIRNNGALTMRIFPFTGQQIDALGADTATTLATATAIRFVAGTASSWVTF